MSTCANPNCNGYCGVCPPSKRAETPIAPPSPALDSGLVSAFMLRQRAEMLSTREIQAVQREVASLRASIGETQRENAQLRKERSEPRLLPDGVSECPTCGAETNHDAFLLYSIDRVTRWRAECHPNDANCITIYDDALDEMRAELSAAPPDSPLFNPILEPTEAP